MLELFADVAMDRGDVVQPGSNSQIIQILIAAIIAAVAALIVIIILAVRASKKDDGKTR